VSLLLKGSTPTRLRAYGAMFDYLVEGAVKYIIPVDADACCLAIVAILFSEMLDGLLLLMLLLFAHQI
jgi:hypothetical protein